MTRYRMWTACLLIAVLPLVTAACTSACEQYCTLLADCIDDEWDGDYEYWGYTDYDDAYEECIDNHVFAGGPAIQRANQNVCAIAIDVFDLDECY
jgi:hypothetical protein